MTDAPTGTRPAADRAALARQLRQIDERYAAARPALDAAVERAKEKHAAAVAVADEARRELLAAEAAVASATAARDHQGGRLVRALTGGGNMPPAITAAWRRLGGMLAEMNACRRWDAAGSARSIAAAREELNKLALSGLDGPALDDAIGRVFELVVADLGCGGEAIGAAVDAAGKGVR